MDIQERKRNIYNAIQNLYNMDFKTWQEVLSMLYNLVSDVEQKFEVFESKFEIALGEEVTFNIKEMVKNGTLGDLINKTLLKEIIDNVVVISENVDKFKDYFNTQLYNNVFNLDSKINEVANKGTTVAVLERVTKNEIENQINDGRLPLLSIKDKTITDKKIKNNSLTFPLLDSDIQEKVKELNVVFNEINHLNGFVTSYGGIQDIELYSYKKIPVVEGETIYVTSNCVGASGALAVFVNKENQFISCYKKVADDGGKYYIDEPITIPSGVDFALICTKNKNVMPVIIKKYNFLNVLNLKNNVIKINKRLTKIGKNEIGHSIPYEIGFLTSTGFIQEQFDSYKYKIIPVSPNKAYYVTAQCKKNAGALVCYYDKVRKNLGSYKPNSELTTHIYDYVDEKIITPDNCFFIGVCTSNTQETPVIIKEETDIDIDFAEMNTFIESLIKSLVDIELKEIHKNIEHISGFVTFNGGIQLIGNYSYKKIPVVEGETIYVTSNCVGTSGALAVFVNNENQFVSYYKKVADVGGKYYIDEPIKVPEGVAYALICTSNKEKYPVKIKKEIEVIFNYKDFTELKNVLGQDGGLVSKKSFDELLYEKIQLEERIYSLEQLNEFDWKPFNKAYVVIIIDDGRHDLYKFLKIFNEFEMPLSCALMTSNLDSFQDDGRKLIDVALDIQSKGGEILCHSTSGEVFTETTTEEDANERLRTSKKILTEKGLIINGFVKPGGTGALGRLDKFEHLMRKYYRYGYSAGHSTAYSSGRYDMREDLPRLISRIDNAIASKSKVIFYSHSFDNDEVTEVKLRGLLEYIKNNKDKVEIVTTKYLYDNFKSTKLENRLLKIENRI